MRTDKLITISQIKARQNAINSTNESTTDVGNLYLIAKNSIDKNLSTIREDAYRFFHECRDKHNANTYAMKCLSTLESVKDNSALLQILESKFAHEVVPYIEKLEGLKDSLRQYSLAESTLETINEAIKVNKICDRIVINDAKLSKRFNFDKFIRENHYKPFDQTVIKCCEMLDTYSTPSYAKLNIALEELSYIYQKNAMEYDRPRMVQLVTEYFLSNGNIDKDELDNFATILKENYCISDTDLAHISYVTEEFVDPEGDDQEAYNPYDLSKVLDKLNNCVAIFNAFKLSEKKSLEDLMGVYNRISEEPVNYQIEALDELFDWLINFGIDIYQKEINDLITGIKHYLESVLEKAKAENQLGKFLDAINNGEAKIRTFDDYMTKYGKLYDVLAKIEEDIELSNQEMMSESQSLMESMLNESDDIISIQEFKILKFQNLLRYAHDINKKLKKKEGKFMTKVKNKAVEVFQSVKNWLNEDYDMSLIKEENILDCISAKGNFDYTISIYEASKPEYVSDVRSALDEFCKENTKAEEGNFVYYVESGNLFEIHISNNTHVYMTEAEEAEWSHIFTEAEQAYAGYMMNMLESLEKYDELFESNLHEGFAKIEDTLTADGVLGIIEASKYLVNMIPLSRLQEIADNYADNNPTDYIGNTAISQALDNWRLEESDMDMVLDTMSLLSEAIDNELLTEEKINTKVDTSIKANNKKPEKKEDKPAEEKGKLAQAKDNAKENLEKIQKTKFNFNTLKYAMEDLKLKSKNAGDKAQQASNTLNMYVEKFINAVKSLYTNDDREQIIRGSIIPSFKQIMGRLLVIAGLSGGVGIFFTSSAAVFTAVLSTFVTIALSKKSTDKERALMLDELDIEMDVCEKEMQRAESAGQMKKYRALSYRLTKLKREYQRIRYNIGYKEYKHTSVVKHDNR